MTTRSELLKLAKPARKLGPNERLCKRCSGSGHWVEKDQMCWRCQGTGKEALKTEQGKP